MIVELVVVWWLLWLWDISNFDEGHAIHAQTMEAASFSTPSRPVDDVEERSSIWMLGSVRGIPMLNSVAFSLLMLA